MKKIEVLGDLTDLVRPVIYLSSDLGEDALKKMADMFAPGDKGTLIVASMNNVDEKSIEWNHRAMDLSNFCTFWFADNRDASISGGVMLAYNLGRTVGRYQIGGGPDNVVVGVSPSSVAFDGLGWQINTQNIFLNGPWKVFKAKNKEIFVEHITDLLVK